MCFYPLPSKRSKILLSGCIHIYNSESLYFLYHCIPTTDYLYGQIGTLSAIGYSSCHSWDACCCLQIIIPQPRYLLTENMILFLLGSFISNQEFHFCSALSSLSFQLCIFVAALRGNKLLIGTQPGWTCGRKWIEDTIFPPWIPDFLPNYILGQGKFCSCVKYEINYPRLSRFRF